MQLKLVIKNKLITILFLKNTEIISQKQWTDENNLLEKFFPTVDEMLEEKNLEITDIKDFILENDVPEGYMTERIAKTIIQTLNFASK